MRALALPLLAAALLGACKDDGPMAPQVDPQLGELIRINVATPRAGVEGDRVKTCEQAEPRWGRVVVRTDRAIIVADTANPRPGFSDADYQEFGRQFDQLVWPVITENFGEPTDRDRNGRVVIFFTSAVNALSKSGAATFTAGFFFARDLFPTKSEGGLQGCATSNSREMFYMLVPEPGIENTNDKFHIEQVRKSTVAVIAHEFQHLINYSRRLDNSATRRVADMETWLDEGLSHIAEELVFYRATGLAPRQNLGSAALTGARVPAFNMYMVQNFVRLRDWLKEPNERSPYGVEDENSLATRGAAWQFLRYAADQTSSDDATVWQRAIGVADTSGMAIVRQTFGTDPMPLFRDWAVAQYTDDFVPGVGARLQHPSWDFRSVYGRLGLAYPLAVRRLAPGSTEIFPLIGGGAAYLRFGAPLAGRAEVAVRAGGVEPGAACETVPPLAVGKEHHFPAGPRLVCVPGIGGTAEYVLVVFGSSPRASVRTEVAVTARNVVSLTTAAVPDLLTTRSPALPRSFSLAERHWRFEEGLRASEHAVLGPLGGARSASATTAAGPQDVQVTIVRTR